MKRIILLALLLLTACTTHAASPELPAPVKTDIEPLPNLGAAPELHNQVWLNTEQPLRLADLRGQVVLLEMWTFG